MANYIRYANQGATRNQPLSPDLVKALGYLGDMGITANVFSGGQEDPGPRRTGSHRHDNGGSGDMEFFQGDRRLDWANPQDVPIFQQIVSKGRENGITGFGAGPGYMKEGSMHVGFGNPMVWGAGGKSVNAPEWLRSAFNGAPMGTNMAGAPPQSAQTAMASVSPQNDPVADVIAAKQMASAAPGTGGLTGTPPSGAFPAAPAAPNMGDKIGSAIFGDDLAAKLRTNFGQDAAPNPLNKGLGLLGGAMGMGKSSQPSEEASIAPSPISQTDGADAARASAAQQLMASMLLNKKKIGTQMGSRML